MICTSEKEKLQHTEKNFATVALWIFIKRGKSGSMPSKDYLHHTERKLHHWNQIFSTILFWICYKPFYQDLHGVMSERELAARS
jgi:phosphoribulokinase